MEIRLKEVRQKKNMTQEELSKKSGVNRTTIHFLETGKLKSCQVSTLCKLALALDVELRDIFF